MKAVVYEGPRQVSVKEVPDARVERPTDVLVRITTTNICGSDLHMYEGRTDFETGRWFGHENMGEVVEVGDGVDEVRVGDRVVLPFNVACGHCKNCEHGLTNYCLTAQPKAEWAGAAYGFADVGPWAGGQAELLRVPWGDFNCLRLGEDADEKSADDVMLADIWPTGYHATELAGVSPGDQTVIYGAGPVGLMAALSATVRGASKVMVVDRHPDRLRLAESIGAIAIDDSKVDPVQAVLEQTMGLGADNGCECVGYQAHDASGDEHPNDTMNKLVASVRFTGKIGSIGVFVPQDPGAEDELAKNGQIAFDYGTFWFRGQHIGSGQAPVKKYNRQLRDLIAAGGASPSFVVSHQLPLDQAPEAYQHFDARDEGWTKVVLRPEGCDVAPRALSVLHALRSVRSAVPRPGGGAGRSRGLSGWLAVTVLRPVDEVDVDHLPAPLAALHDRIEVRTSPASRERGTELAARLLDAPRGSSRAARLGGEDPEAELRVALRQAKQLLEVGELLVVDPVPHGERTRSPGGAFVERWTTAAPRAGVR